MDARRYYNEECYAQDNCMHCQDCLAFALLHWQQLGDSLSEKTLSRERSRVVKFLAGTITSGSLPCPRALPRGDLRPYIDRLLSGDGELPICHYELARYDKR